MKINNLFKNKTTVILITGFILSIDGPVNAQLKLFSNGDLSVGSIIQPPPNSELQISGNTLFSKNTGTIISSAYIKGINFFSTDSLPEYSWWGDTLTGIFHPGLDMLAYTNTGRETMRLTQANNMLIGSTTDNGDRLQITGALNKNTLDIYSDYSSSSGYSAINWLNDTNTKAWTVKYNTQDKFYVYGSGQAYSYGWNTMSDSTLKENVCNIKNALTKVLKLQGVTYNLKQSTLVANAAGLTGTNLSSVKMGLIAQSVERVVPEVVTTTGDGIKTVAYGNLVGLLVEALKEEDNKIDRLKQILDSMNIRKGIEITDGNKTKTDTTVNIQTNEKAKLYPCKIGPVNEEEKIHCYIPSGSINASILVFDLSGALKKSIPINGKNEQFVSMSKNQLSAGAYYYSLVVDGKEIDMQKMILTE